MVCVWVLPTHLWTFELSGVQGGCHRTQRGELGVELAGAVLLFSALLPEQIEVLLAHFTLGGLEPFPQHIGNRAQKGDDHEHAVACEANGTRVGYELRSAFHLDFWCECNPK